MYRTQEIGFAVPESGVNMDLNRINSPRSLSLSGKLCKHVNIFSPNPPDIAYLPQVMRVCSGYRLCLARRDLRSYLEQRSATLEEDTILNNGLLGFELHWISMV